MAECVVDVIQEEEADNDRIQPGKHPLTIIVIGKTGVGKSTLINSLLGDTIDRPAVVTDGLEPTNHKILERHEGLFLREHAVVYDTKGIGNPKFDDDDLVQEFKGMIAKDSHIVVLICQKIGDSFDSNRRFAKLLARHFGDKYNIWKKCIFVLTKANLFEYEEERTNDDIDPVVIKELRLQILKEEWKIAFGQFLNKYGVPGKITSERPICIAGDSDDDPFTQNWMEALHQECKSVEKDDQEYSASSKRKFHHAIAGAVIGGVMFPVAGVPIGYMIGWYIGKKKYMKKIQTQEDKKCEKSDIHQRMRKRSTSLTKLSRYATVV